MYPEISDGKYVFFDYLNFYRVTIHENRIIQSSGFTASTHGEIQDGEYLVKPRGVVEEPGDFLEKKNITKSKNRIAPLDLLN